VQQSTRTLLGAVVAGAVCGGSAFGAVIASEDFEGYSAGALVPQGAAAGGWSDSWKASFAGSTSANNVTVFNQGGSQVGGVQGTAANSGVAYRALSTPLADVDGNVYYIVVDGQKLNDSARFFGITLLDSTQASEGAAEQLNIGAGSGIANWSVSNVDVGGGVKGNKQSSLATSDEATLVIRLEMKGAGVVDKVSFWVNPDFNLIESSATNVAAQVADSIDLYGNGMTGIGSGGVTMIRMGGGNSNASSTFNAHWFDDLLITTDSPFAVPEPATLFMAGIGLVAVSARRRNVA